MISTEENRRRSKKCSYSRYQADMLKEAMYKIDQKFKEQQVENCMLLNVHDELVWKHRSLHRESFRTW